MRDAPLWRRIAPYHRQIMLLHLSLVKLGHHPLCRIRIQGEEDLAEMARRRQAEEAMKFQHAEASALGQQPAKQGDQAAAAPAPLPFVREGRKVGRNEPCPCGSGKKFKQCHGKLN